ncbi:MAG: DUF1566 domain-containing protein [Candidatus Sumerlaeota bacterium]|nr:DUF1566 domain-containing protein [Candidatus Sumerlaeota bacterium]
MLILSLLCCAGLAQAAPTTYTYAIVGTGQAKCYDSYHEIAPPALGQAFFGQDAQIKSVPPAYRDNGDGTISDLNTGLMWVKARGAKMTWDEAVAGAASCRLGGYSDWRTPTIKELYSLINFEGGFRFSAAQSKPYFDAKVFEFKYGDAAAGEREIDCQDWSATQYLSTTMNNNPTVFGVNFADGRIKGYPKSVLRPGAAGRVAHKMYVRYVRGNPKYGVNEFRDNGDGTISDLATGLMWQKADSGKGCNWQEALAYAAGLKLAGHGDWRVPTAKELQSIVDYTRAPAVTNSAAINPIFSVSEIESFYWSSTTHLDGPPERMGSAAVYVAFGRATGYMQFPPGAGPYRLMDVHGAGAQRSDPKTGNPADFPNGRGPQGDAVRIYNYVRCVRGGLAP